MRSETFHDISTSAETDSAAPDVAVPSACLQVGLVADPLASKYWPAAKRFLEPALMLGDDGWPDVEPRLACEADQLWLVVEDGAPIAAAVTRVVGTRDIDVTEIYLVGGIGFRRWIKPLNDAIRQAAQAVGHKGLRAYGRFGWRDTLADLGWTQRACAYGVDFHGA